MLLWTVSFLWLYFTNMKLNWTPSMEWQAHFEELWRELGASKCWIFQPVFILLQEHLNGVAAARCFFFPMNFYWSCYFHNTFERKATKTILSLPFRYQLASAGWSKFSGWCLPPGLYTVNRCEVNFLKYALTFQSWAGWWELTSEILKWAPSPAAEPNLLEYFNF